MAADIRRLDGSAVEPAQMTRNERVAELLAELVARNEAGRVACMAIVSLTPEGWHETNWCWPPKTDGFPWGLALHGALAMIQAELSDAAVHSTPMPEPEPAPKG